MAKKKKHAEHVNHERWLVSYADFITLLFAFFVVMFAASNSDHKKAGQVSQAVQNAFQELAVFSPGGKMVPISDDRGVPANSSAVMGGFQAGAPAKEAVKAGERGEGGKDGKDGRGGQGAGRGAAGGVAPTIPEVKKQIEQALKEQLEKKIVRVSEDGRGLIISLSEAGFFSPGSDIMQPKGVGVLEQIIEKAAALPNPIRVEGHTDNTPIHTAQFPSNWELSASRATHVLQYLLEAKISPDRVSVVGYADVRPIAKNTDAEGRAANRRVDLVILGASAQALEPK